MTTWVLFDVNGTLTDPRAITSPWARPDLGADVLDQAVHTAMVETLTVKRMLHPFSEHLRAALELIVAKHGLEADRIEQGASAAAELPARPGAQEALEVLASAGLRLAALTNSGTDSGRATLKACGLSNHFDQVLGVEAVSRCKPDPAVYDFALQQLNIQPAEVTLLATHPWDLAGATASGIRTAWVRHQARAWPVVLPTPDVEADTLPELARALV